MLVLATALILLLWLASAVVFVGVGMGWLRLVEPTPRLTYCFWAGLTAWVAFLEFWHLVLPMTGASLIVPIIAGVVGVWLGRDHLKDQIRGLLTMGRGPILLYVAAVALLAVCATGPCRYGDTGTYGAPAVRWIQMYPAVPGLANVHGRLGFDSAVMLCVAALGPGRYIDLGYHLFPGLILSALAASVFPAWWKAWRKGRLAAWEWFMAMLALPVINWSLRGFLVGTVTDLPTSVAELLAISIMIGRMTRADPSLDDGSAPDPGANSPASASRLPVVAALCAVAVAFKLSAAAIAGTTWAVGFFWICRAGDLVSSRRRTRDVLLYVLIPAIVLVPWLICHVITSGYPFYPSTFAPFHVDWLVPPSVAHTDADWIQQWARIPDVPPERTAGLAWVGVWFVRNAIHSATFDWPLIISASAVVFLIVNRLKGLGRRADSGPWAWMLAPALCGLGFWFWAAPDPRFGEGAIWSTTAILAVLALTRIDWNRHPPLPRTVAIALVVIASLGPPPLLRHELLDVLRAPNTGLFPLPPYRGVTNFTRWGLCVYVSKTGDCWDGPLPNTPYFNPDLALRDPADMGKGFKVVQAAP